jgi:hypothetical protein
VGREHVLTKKRRGRLRKLGNISLALLYSASAWALILVVVWLMMQIAKVLPRPW